MGTLVPPTADLPAVPLVEELAEDLSPWEAFRRLAARPGVLFLDSALSHPTLGRYSFVTSDPFLWLRSRGLRVHVSGEPAPRSPADPLAVLSELLARYRIVTVPGLPPFQGGVAGLFGYDLCHHIERLPRPQWNEFAVSDMAVGFYDWVIAFDHAQNQAWLISTGFPEANPEARRRRAQHRCWSVRRWLGRSPPITPAHRYSGRLDPVRAYPVPGLPALTSNFHRPGYLTAVRRAIDYVHAGDCFQVNLSQRLLC